MKVVLVNPRTDKADRFELFDFSAPPMGLAYIAAVLEKNNHSVQIIDRDVLLHKNDMDFEKADRQTLDLIDSFKTDIVGITATTPNIPDVIHISREIKRKSSMRIVLGGPHSTGEPEMTLKECPDIDISAVGEGEFIMLDLANDKLSKDILSIAFRKNGQIIHTDKREPFSDIDKLPYPARHLLDMRFYTRPSRLAGRNLTLRTTSIFTARGCPYRCSFCAGPIIFPGKVRFHSHLRVINEIQELIDKWQVEAVYFAEDMFLSSKSRAREVLSLFEKNGLGKKIKWFAQVRPDVVDEELLTLMKRNGCAGVEYGFESGSNRILSLMGKQTTAEKNLDVVRITKKAKMRLQANIIAGYPGETEEDFKKTISFLRKTRPDNIGFNLFMPLPGTAIYNKLKSEGKLIPNWEDIGNIEAPENNYALMPKKRFEKLYYRARLCVILPNNLFHFIKDNILHPWSLAYTILTQSKSIINRAFRELVKLGRLKRTI